MGNGPMPIILPSMESAPISELRATPFQCRVPEEPCLHSVFRAGQTVLYQWMRCRNFVYKRPRLPRSSDEHRAGRSRLQRGRGQMISTARHSNISAMMCWTQGTGSTGTRIIHRFPKLEIDKTISAACSEARLSGTRPSFYFLMEVYDCDNQQHRKALYRTMPRGSKLHHQ